MGCIDAKSIVLAVVSSSPVAVGLACMVAHGASGWWYYLMLAGIIAASVSDIIEHKRRNDAIIEMMEGLSK